MSVICQNDADLLLAEFAHVVESRITKLHWPKKRLAHEMNHDPSYLSHILHRGTNLTLETLVTVTKALKLDVKIVYTPIDDD